MRFMGAGLINISAAIVMVENMKSRRNAGIFGDAVCQPTRRITAPALRICTTNYRQSNSP